MAGKQSLGGPTRTAGLSHRVHACPIRSGATAGKVIEPAVFERLLDLYYQKRGWDERGNPPAEVESSFAAPSLA